MLSVAAVIHFTLGFAVCVPHTHILKNAFKENIEDGNYVARDNDHFKDGIHNYEFDHESILGSHVVAEEFHHLSPELSKSRLKLLAFKMDTDKDLFVDRKELISWVLQSFKTLTEEEAQEELEDEDKDQDGKVTWEEHAAEAYGMYDDDLLLSPNTEFSETIEYDKEMFEAADTNGDNFLDEAEYPGFSHPEEFQHMYQVVYQQTMKKRDKNSDGFLSFEEFIADNDGSIPDQMSDHYASEKDRYVHDLDKNGDMKLDKEEVLLWVIPDNVESAENEADHLIESSDTNKDGKLSIDEIVDHHEIFVGSEATDFGEQLQNNRYIDEL